IEQLRLKHHRVHAPNKVIVLGGGNTAMDAASESARMGAGKVILAYRRSKEEMGAYEFEYELAKEVGVQGMFNVAPLEILGGTTEENLNQVTGVRFIKTELVDGTIKIIPGSEFVEECNWVIKATGQSKQTELVSLIGQIDTHQSGTIKVDAFYRTTNPKYFAAGDAVSGGQEVVNAVADGKKAGHGIVKYLTMAGLNERME
ncbi:MAG: FAD-dependent oxidoreductase, partial [Bacteroidota bacterium]|nr:FAD-dependent oxidoreductase [Bacteroidota bacterium]